jgi:hypothetical protein
LFNRRRGTSVLGAAVFLGETNMANEHKGEHFTRWMHMESGKTMVRRLHRMEVQAADGKLHVITGTDLPEAMVTSAGDSHTGQHLAQILLRKDGGSLVKTLQSFTWRDAAYVAIGLWAREAIEAIAAVAEVLK